MTQSWGPMVEDRMVQILGGHLHQSDGIVKLLREAAREVLQQLVDLDLEFDAPTSFARGYEVGKRDALSIITSSLSLSRKQYNTLHREIGLGEPRSERALK